MLSLRHFLLNKSSVSECVHFFSIFHWKKKPRAINRNDFFSLLHKYSTNSVDILHESSDKEVIADLHRIAAQYSPSKVQLLENYLGISKIKAEEMNGNFFKKVLADELESTIIVLKDFFTVDHSQPSDLIPLLKLPSWILLDSIGKMNDLGMSISLETYELLKSIWNQPFREAVATKAITDVGLYETLERIGLPQDLISSINCEGKYHVKKVWKQAYGVFFQWKFGNKVVHHRRASICLDNEAIEFYRKEFKMSKSKILMLKYSWNYAYKKNISRLLSLKDIPIKQILKFSSKELLKQSSFYQKKAIFDYLHPTGQTDGQIYHLPLDTIIKNVETLLQTTSLYDFRLTPNIFYILYNTDNYIKAFTQIQQKYSLRYLIPSKLTPSKLEKCSTLSGLNTMYIKEFICSHFHIYVLKVSSFLQITNLQDVISPDDLKLNYIFLRKHFSYQQIKTAWQIVCYPNGLVVSHFVTLNDSPLGQEYKETQQMDRLLQLYLYYVHRDFRKKFNSDEF